MSRRPGFVDSMDLRNCLCPYVPHTTGFRIAVFERRRWKTWRRASSSSEV